MFGAHSSHSSKATENCVFATTRWTLVLQARQPDSAEARSALSELYRNYSYPLYAYFRRKGQNELRSEDLVQEIFLALIRNNQLSTVAPEKGRFRSYLLAAANHLLANEWHKQQAEKRGSGQELLELDALSPEHRYRLEPVDDRSPDLLFEQRWALAVLDGVMTQLREEWKRDGKETQFEVLQVYLSMETPAPSYAETGASIQLNENAARVAVFRLRQRYRDLLHAEIARTVENEADIQSELRHLLKVLRQ